MRSGLLLPLPTGSSDVELITPPIVSNFRQISIFLYSSNSVPTVGRVSADKLTACKQFVIVVARAVVRFIRHRIPPRIAEQSLYLCIHRHIYAGHVERVRCAVGHVGSAGNHERVVHGSIWARIQIRHLFELSEVSLDMY